KLDNRGCGRCYSSTTKAARQLTAMQHRAEMRWQHSLRAGGGNSAPTESANSRRAFRHPKVNCLLLIPREILTRSDRDPARTSLWKLPQVGRGSRLQPRLPKTLSEHGGDWGEGLISDTRAFTRALLLSRSCQIKGR